MLSFANRFPQAFEEWVAAGGAENNFRVHALAIGLLTPTAGDVAFAGAQALIARRQELAIAHFYTTSIDATKPATQPSGHAADISYLTGEIDQAFCDMLVDLDVDLVIVGLQDIDLARRQLTILQNNGFKLHAYIWPQNKNLVTYLPEVYDLMQRYSIPYIWVDVEDSGFNVDAAIADLRKHQGFVVGIYTSAFMWLKYMGTTEQYQYLPLWYARYDDKPDMSNFVPFAGWHTPTMKQYNSDNPRYDLDVYNPDLLPLKRGITVEELAAERDEWNEDERAKLADTQR